MSTKPTEYWFDDAAKVADYLQTQMTERGMDPGNLKDGLILWSWLGKFPEAHMARTGDGVSDGFSFSFTELLTHINQPGPEWEVEGHARKIIIAPLKSGNAEQLVIAQSGREHLYEWASPQRATFWLRVMQILGVQNCIGSNAVWAISGVEKIPSLAITHDSIDFDNWSNPLTGPNDDRLGPRFPHKSDFYPEKSRTLIKDIAGKIDIRLPESIYFRLPWPSYESPAEVYRLRTVAEGIRGHNHWQHGVPKYDANMVTVVGMSSTYEALVMQHAAQSKQFPAFQWHRAFISGITNYAAGLGPNGPVAPPNHNEVQERIAEIEEQFSRLVHAALRAFHAKLD